MKRQQEQEQNMSKKDMVITALGTKLVLHIIPPPERNESGVEMPKSKMYRISGPAAKRYMAMTAEVEEWDDPGRLDEALKDVEGGMDVSMPCDYTFSELRYGMVVGENPELSRKVAGFPQFGDIVLFHAKRGVDCASFSRLSRGSGSIAEYSIASHDGTRRTVVPRGSKLIILKDAEEDIAGIKWTFTEMVEMDKDVT